mmetsp:Transcript_20814/g.28671  ORF Transcript_20814/g.28671 Transcript_20814/m.28671 type:complete len:80 (-) Transcript_20814:62-301(-)
MAVYCSILKARSMELMATEEEDFVVAAAARRCPCCFAACCYSLIDVMMMCLLPVRSRSKSSLVLSFSIHHEDRLSMSRR